VKSVRVEPLDQRVLINQLRKSGLQALVEIGDRDRERLIRGDLVVTDPVARHQPGDDLKDAVTELSEVLKPVGLPDELQQQLGVGQRLTSQHP
jgi:hypothetical protein